MSWPQPGDTVKTTRDGAGHNDRVGGRTFYGEGEELQVTSVATRFVRVRSLTGGNVFRIDREYLRPVPRLVGQVPEGGIAPEDPRIAWIFEDAARMADRLGLCADFDRICDAIGLPGRVRTFRIKMLSADGIEVTAKVEARSKRLAEMRLRERITPPAPRELEQVRS